MRLVKVQEVRLYETQHPRIHECAEPDRSYSWFRDVFIRGRRVDYPLTTNFSGTPITPKEVKERLKSSLRHLFSDQSTRHTEILFKGFSLCSLCAPWLMLFTPKLSSKESSL
jgi:hypothetical protein